MIYPLLSLLSAALLSAACNSGRQLTGDAAYTSVKLEQGGCFGTCPVYDLEILPGGSATYDGKQYAPFPGLQNASLPADSTTMLNGLVDEVLAQADRLETPEGPEIADAATSTITVLAGGDTLRFQGSINFAPPVARLRDALQRVPDYAAWEADSTAAPLPPSKLLVTLTSAEAATPLAEYFFFEKLETVRQVSEEPVVFLMRFSGQAVDADDLAGLVREQESVVAVEILTDAEAEALE